MKKFALILALILCFGLCACGEDTPAATGGNTAVRITAGKIEAHMTVEDVLAEVTVNHQPVACRVELTRFTPEGFYVMAADELVGEAFYGRLDVYYSLPAGVDVEDIEVTMTCDGSEYDGTGSVGNDEKGCVEAWSHAIYGTEPPAPHMYDVQIKVDPIGPDVTAETLAVEIAVDGQAVAAKVELVRFTGQGYYVMPGDEPAGKDFFGRLDLYYSLPEGVDVEDMEVSMTCPGGEYDGTGSISLDAKGCVVAWSHAVYGEEPAVTPTEPTEPTQPAHTHKWVEDGSASRAPGCESEGYTAFVCDCGETKRETVPALGHEIVTVSDRQPTCTASGLQTSRCNRCSQQFLNELPATGHSWSGWTYENGRLHKHSCSVCGAEETADHVIPSGTVKCTDCGADIIN